MKKLLILFSLIALTFTSCSSDDDGGYQDPFVGSWRYFTSYEDEVEYPLDDCENQDTIDVSSNGTFTTTLHFDYGSGCEVDEILNGTWDNLGESIYSSTIDGETFVQEVTFEGNMMYFDEVDGGVTYRDVFVRL